MFDLIYNQDSTNLFSVTKGLVTPAHVDAMVDEVADAGGDIFLVNPNAQKVNYPSEVWETYWDGYLPENGCEVDHFIKMGILAETCDYLERSLGRCRHKGITPGVSVRMNDMHDAPNPKSHMHSVFWRQHPEFRLKDPSRGWGGTGLNYEYPEVRHRFLLLIDEIVNNYDLEFLELDFMRFSCYFERGDMRRHCQTMTGFIREVRSVIDASGKAIKLVPRVASTPSSAYSLGFDVGAWAEETLIDGITTGMFLNNGWELPVDQFREVVKDRVPVYPSTEFTAWRLEHGCSPRHISTDRELMRGVAAGAHALGAGGLSLFNFFCARESVWMEDTGAELVFDVFAELRDVDILRKLPRRNLITTGTSFNFEVDLPLQVPADLRSGITREFRMLLLASEPDAEITCVAYLDNEPAPEQIFLHVNSFFIGTSERVEIVPKSEGVCQAIFQLPPASVVDGWNVLRLASTVSVTVLSLEVIVGK